MTQRYLGGVTTVCQLVLEIFLYFLIYYLTKKNSNKLFFLDIGSITKY